MSQDQIVIVGAGHAGVQAAVRLHELEWPGQIVLVDESPDTPYERPPLSKEYLKGVDSEISLLRKSSFYEHAGIELVKGDRVVGVDLAAHTVDLDSGRQLVYTKLIFATGSEPRALPVTGSDLPGVYYLKTRADAESLRSALLAGSRLVIIGAGYIGLEVAAAGRVLGCDTTVIEFQDRVMSRVTSSVVSDFFETVHRAEGTRFVFGAAVSEIGGVDRADNVVTSAGDSYPADVVVVGVGVAPREALARDAGILCDDGILIDEHSQTSDQDVYACGDVARLVIPSISLNRRLESIQSAVSQSRLAAEHIMGRITSELEVPWFWTVQHGVRLQTAGLRLPEDEILVRPVKEESAFTVLYLRDGRLAALDTVGSLRDFPGGKKLVAQQATIDREIARDGSRRLAEAAL